jgi:hypothetical protein
MTSYGEHDFGALEIEGERLFFKIDYYDQSLSAHSPDPADETLTKRVLTIMLAGPPGSYGCTPVRRPICSRVGSPKPPWDQSHQNRNTCTKITTTETAAMMNNKLMII